MSADDGGERIDRVESILRKQPLFAILRSGDAEKARAAAEAVFDAGLRLIEVAMTVPEPLVLVERLASRGDVVAGAGSVTTIKEAVEAIERGACFVVCPHTDRMIIDYCRDHGVFVAAGGLTPTEIMTAHLVGAHMVKVYPVSAVGGADYIRRMLMPMPFLRLMPAGGVELDEIESLLQAGAAAIGSSTTMIHPDMLERGDFEGIRKHAGEFLEKVLAFRREQPSGR